MALDPDFQALLGAAPPAKASTPVAAKSSAAPAAAAPSQGGLDPDFQALMDLPATKEPPPQESGSESGPSLKDYLAGPAETVASALSNTALSAVGGAASLIDSPLYAAGLTKVRPDSIVKGAQSYAYQPRTAFAQKALGGVSSLMDKASNFVGDSVQQAAPSWFDLSPEGSAVAGGIGAGIPTAATMLLGGEAPALGAAKAPAAAASTLSPELAAGARMGLKFTPEQAGSGFVPRAVQSLSGSAKLERSLSKQNAPVVDAAGVSAASMPAGTRLTPQGFSRAKVPFNAIYDQAGQTGTVDLTSVDPTLKPIIAEARTQLRLPQSNLDALDAQDLVTTVRQLRAMGNANQSAPKYMPSQKLLGRNQMDAAEELDNALDQHIQSLSKTGQIINGLGAQATLPGANLPPDFMQQLLGARRSLAQIASVQNATRSGHLIPQLLAKQRGLTGDLKTIADSYGQADRSLQDVNKIRDGGPFGVLDLFAGAGGLELAHLNPKVAIPALAAVMSRPGLRALMGSQRFQRSVIQGIPKAPVPASYPALLRAGRVAPLLAQQPQPQGLLPAP